MENIWYILAIFALLSIIPSAVVFCVLFMRLLAVENGLKAAIIREEAIQRLTEADHKQNDAVCSLEAKVSSLDESLGFLNNKMNARLKAEKKIAARAEQDEEREAFDGVPVEQQTLPFPVPPAPMSQPSNGGARAVRLRPKLF